MIHDFRYTWDWDTYTHLAEHKRITSNIAELVGKVDVVITHFPPTPEAIDQELYAGNKTNPYFINNAEPLVEHVGAKLWVSGHTHRRLITGLGRQGSSATPGAIPAKTPGPGFP